MTPGSNCRSGCKERNHRTYGECLRSARVRTTFAATPNNSWDSELELYSKARAEGIQPDSTSTQATMEAIAFSDKHGTAYDAGDTISTMARAGILPEGAVT
jgi:hypothetical protein